MKENMELIYLIEKLAANAWPAHSQKPLEQWQLRANLGITKRANSVYTLGPVPKDNSWLQIIEEFYQSQSISPCFYISSGSPLELDDILLAKGYEKLDECLLMVGTCTEVLERVPYNYQFTVDFISEADELWIQDFLDLEGFPAQNRQGYSWIFSSIKQKKSFIRISENKETVGLGTVVLEEGWGGISNIIVSSSHRRKGIAAQLFRAISQWSYENDVTHLYLQVLKDNTPAVMLYKKMGFLPISEHHYRKLSS